VDALTRTRLQDELLRIWEQFGVTVLMVTHSIHEALLLADRLLVLTPRPGRVHAALTVDLPRPRRAQPARLAEWEQRIEQELLGERRPERAPGCPPSRA
jgi:ABC-type nitrate/sulfonate/bicarbonate transport system ATPase subunit